ncbi:MAG TPA: histone deacetylase family protein [Methylomirabilota bacterium]|nr:histone deacetylase family protein [Methylomirabilota bacterium]
MFRIRRVYDTILARDRGAVEQVQRMLAERLPDLDRKEIEDLPDKLRRPVEHGFRAILYVAENQRRTVKAFALVFHEPDIGFVWLDFLASAGGSGGRGVGGTLYERVRADARELGAWAVLFECLPDDPALCPDPGHRRQNAARLRFYEGFGARPVVGTAYETPVKPGDVEPPYLVVDDLGRGRAPSRSAVRAAVRAVLERKYGHLCPPEYVDRVVASFTDDPVRLRPFRYLTPSADAVAESDHRSEPPPPDRRIALVVNDRHLIHHVRERGYVESPVRIDAIRRQLDPTGLFDEVVPRRFPDRHLVAVHDRAYVGYLERVCKRVGEGRAVYPYVFPIRNAARPPRELEVRAGYYCIDTFTPLDGNAYRAARRAVDCSLTAAAAVLEGRRLAYALIRPPGHHAERRAFGGFCYFNNAAVAANELARHGRVAILDIDYHHGNGQQDIFWERDEVLTISIHGHPNFAYPYFSGFADEVGSGRGRGANRNYPLEEHVDGRRYREVLERALRRVEKHRTEILVVALGLDTSRKDPTGSWDLGTTDFAANGRLVGALRLPTLVVQEGGYRIRNLGVNARSFFTGLWQASVGLADRPGPKKNSPKSPPTS